MTTTTEQFDQAKADAFAARTLDTINRACLTLMISVGHRTGLFENLAILPPSTTHEIADAAHLNERYVREWLGTLVLGDVIEFDPVTTRYHLPAEHAAFLIRSAAPNNMAVFTQFISVLGGVEDKIVHCFKHGGGVPYEAFHRFHEVMAEESGQTVLPTLREHILPLVPGLDQRLEQGIRVLDVGCGRGRALHQLAGDFPASRFLGVDLCKDAVEFARAEARRLGLKNLHFECRDVTDFPSSEPFDLITAFDAIHDQKAPDRVLAGIRQHLKPDGVFLMQDISASRDLLNNREHPLGQVIYTVSCMHCMTVSLAQGGAGLGAAWGHETAVDMLEAAGFSRVQKHTLPHDLINCYFVARP